MVRLGDVCDVITKGTTPTSLGFAFQEDGVNFIKIESISVDGEFILEKFEHISNECDDKLKRSRLDTDDILFFIAGALGRTAALLAFRKQQLAELDRLIQSVFHQMFGDLASNKMN